MELYLELVKYLGAPLSDPKFQGLLHEVFIDLSDYNVGEGDYIASKKYKLELGFRNKEAVFDEDTKDVIDQGLPIFSHFNIFPDSPITKLPFGIAFSDTRNQVHIKAGQPIKTNQGTVPILGSYLIDFYNKGDIVVSIDYEPLQGTIKFIQIKSKSFVEH